MYVLLKSGIEKYGGKKIWFKLVKRRTQFSIIRLKRINQISYFVLICFLKTFIFIIEFELVILEGRKIPYKKVANAKLGVVRFPRQVNISSQLQFDFLVTGANFFSIGTHILIR